jgi:hypothetical protein
VISNNLNNIFEIGDILRCVLFNLTTKDFLSCNQVNKHWHQITNEASVFWSHFIPQELKMAPQNYKNCVNCCAVTSLEKLLVRVNQFAEKVLNENNNGQFTCYFPFNDGYNEICPALKSCKITLELNFNEVSSESNNPIVITCLFMGKLSTSDLKTMKDADILYTTYTKDSHNLLICMPVDELCSGPELELKGLGLPALVAHKVVKGLSDIPFMQQIFNICISTIEKHSSSK